MFPSPEFRPLLKVVHSVEVLTLLMVPGCTAKLVHHFSVRITLCSYVFVCVFFFSLLRPWDSLFTVLQKCAHPRRAPTPNLWLNFLYRINVYATLKWALSFGKHSLKHCMHFWGKKPLCYTIPKAIPSWLCTDGNLTPLACLGWHVTVPSVVCCQKLNFKSWQLCSTLIIFCQLLQG